MGTHQKEIIEELQRTMMELSGDVLALELFCLYGEYGMREFGPHVCRAYVKQMEDFLRQHLQDAELLTGHLLEDSRALARSV